MAAALASLVETTWTVIAQAAQAVRDRELLDVANGAHSETARQLAWLNTRIKVTAPQMLLVDPDVRCRQVKARPSSSDTAWGPP